MDNARLTTELERIVMNRIASGRLTIPAMPATATRCLELLRDSDYDTRKLSAIIEAEPIMAALVLRAANAAAHATKLMDIERAIIRLGAKPLKTIVLEYVANQLFESSDPKIRAANQKIYVHSTTVAHLARDIAAFVHVDGEVCYLAGLLHDIGKPLVAAMLLEAERKLAKSGWLDSDAWTATIDRIHRPVGVALAEAWKLPDEITAAIRDCSDYDAGDRKSFGNIVRLANAIAKREGYVTGPVDRDDIDALVMVGRSMLGAEEAIITSLTSNIKQRLATS
jgi:putative nucleotidyltransferase with HDIG domain